MQNVYNPLEKTFLWAQENLGIFYGVIYGAIQWEKALIARKEFD